MAKTKTNNTGTNLRKLSIAYANNRLDRDNYIKLRTRQLSALDFGKPLPEVPAEIAEIVVPTIKVDPPHIAQQRRKKSPAILIIIFVIIASVAAGAYLYWAQGGFGQQASTPAATPVSITSLAAKLLKNPAWGETELQAFQQRWSSYSSEAQSKARQTNWYKALENESMKRINRLKLQREQTDNVREYQKQLNNLRQFHSALTATDANAP